MHRYLLAACAFSLTACQSVPSGGNLTIPAIIAEAQSVAQNVCGFVPAATTVAQILAAGDPTVATVTTIANAICNAVTSTRSVSRTANPNRTYGAVAGVPIKGEFVAR